MGGTRSSHLPLDRKSVLNIISFRSSMPARRDVGNSGVGGKLLQLRSRCVLENISFSLALSLKILHTLSSFNGIHNNGTFCILAFFTSIFCCFFLHFWPIAIGRRRRRTATAKAKATAARGVERQLWVPLSEFAACSALHEWRQPTSARACKCGGVGAWKATDELPSPSLLLSQSLLCTLSCWWWVKVGAH